MEIRHYSPGDDPEEISAIYENSWKFAYKGIIPQDYLDSIPKGRWVRGLVSGVREDLVLIAEGRPVGTAAVCSSRWESHPGCGEIVSIYLLPEYMGRGFGGPLLDRCINELKKKGFRRIILWVLEENLRARHFYEKHGFVCTGEYLDDCIGGRELREVLYRLDVRGEQMDHRIRPLAESEYGVLDDFLYEAIFIPEGVEPPPREIIKRPELRVYTEGFGSRRGDYALCAEAEGRPVGAVWVRIMNDYGHIDDDTPSFAISLYREYRGQGIGTALMREMLALLKSEGFRSASLAVQKANYAVDMYKKVGFEIVGENDEEYIMLCRLEG